MTFTDWNDMTSGRQLFDRSVAEILGELLTARYGTAKKIARAVGISIPTAENIRKGNIRIDTLEKILRVEGRALWNRLGDELFGETFYQFEERRIEAAMKEAEHVRSNLVRLRSQSEELLAGAGLMDPPALGRAPDALGTTAGRSGLGAHPASDRQAEGARNRNHAVEAKSFAPQHRGRR